MIEIKIHKGVHLFNLPNNLKEKIRSDLTFMNPKYKNAVAFGGYYLKDSISKYLYFFAEKKDPDVIFVPKGYAYFIIKEIKKQGLEYKIEDNTTLFEKLDLHFTGDERDYQKFAIKDVTRYPVGVLESGTGSGKTVMGIKMIAVRRQPTLIMVHSKELFKQWKQQIKKFLNYDVGEVGDGKYNVKDITVGIVRSVQNNVDALKDRFGHIIIDETHRCPAATWTDVLSQFTAKYQLGLSATAYRSDGLSHAIYAYIGPKIHKVDRETLNDIGAVLIPRLIRINTGFYIERFQSDHSQTVSSLSSNEERNWVVVDSIEKDINEYGASILVVSDRVNHCTIIKNMLAERDIQSEVLTSTTPKEERESIVLRVKSGLVKVLVSTIQLIGEGFDCPGLNALFLTTPIKYKGRLIQVIGRILRPNEGSEQPRIYDFRDPYVDTLRKMAAERDRTYRREWKI